MPQYNSTQQAMLAQPLAPAPPGAAPNPYGVLAGTQSGSVGMPYGTGNTMTNPGGSGVPTIASGDLAASSGITGAASTSGGSNVGGVLGQGEATDYSTDIPEARDVAAEETNEFIDAYKEGYTTDSGKERGALTMKAARNAKGDDRRDDRSDRQDARKKMKKDLKAKYEAQGMGKGKARRKARRQSRKAKRQTRKGQRAQRKESWDTFKGERDLTRQDQADDLEKYMTD